MNWKIVWNSANYEDYIKYLKSISDEEYKKFNSKIIFTNYEILGIRMPILRNISKNIIKGDYKTFLDISGKTYYEEVMVYLLVIASIKSIYELEVYFDRAINLIDNWALCDTFCGSLKIVEENKAYFLKVIDKLLNSSKVYHIRVGLVLLLNYYISEEYLNTIFNYLDDLKNDDYYVNMAASWLVCEIFTKYQDCGLKYLKHNKLDNFTINKAISKIRDSYRVSKDIKNKVVEYRRK